MHFVFVAENERASSGSTSDQIAGRGGERRGSDHDQIAYGNTLYYMCPHANYSLTHMYPPVLPT